VTDASYLDVLWRDCIDVLLRQQKHHLPHIHAQYADEEAVILIPEGDVIEGSLKTAKLKLVQAWIEIHREELIADWNLAVTGRQVFKIEPLK